MSNAFMALIIGNIVRRSCYTIRYYSLTHSLTHSLTNSFTHSLTHSLTEVIADAWFHVQSSTTTSSNESGSMSVIGMASLLGYTRTVRKGVRPFGNDGNLYIVT